MTLVSDGEPSHDVDVADRNLLDVMTVLGEDLHARALIAAIADDELAVGAHHGDFSREPKLAFFLARHAEVELEASVLLKNLKREKNLKKSFLNYKRIVKFKILNLTILYTKN